ncbi:prepilin-type N-terminal cleavage/methylation domain-containing protein [Desulfobacterales bacterium HSG16]|nr:prepilin-type N-terminal cleavage/methylation domain-containing protein [Desulfobacterales bacterium HSG16]
MKKTDIKRQYGFTLLEVLISIFIFAIIMSTILSSFHAIFSNANTLNEEIYIYDMAKNCLNRMITDLRAAHFSLAPAYVKPQFNDNSDPHRIIGDTGSSANKDFARLRFTSSAHVSFGSQVRGGIAEIVYYVQDREDGTSVLRRADTLLPEQRFDKNGFEPKGSDPVLCENVKSLSFFYYDDEETEYETWDSDSGDVSYSTPVAVKILLETGDENTSSMFETMVGFYSGRKKIK